MNDIERLVEDLYSRGVNVNQYLRKHHPELGEDAIIRFSYDSQAGSYAKEMVQKKEIYEEYGNAIVQRLLPYLRKSSSILDAGCGELTGSIQLINACRHLSYIGVDGSFSRLLAGKKVLIDQGVLEVPKPDLVASSLTNIPLSSSSVDIVFTSHAIEPNSLNSAKIIRELARVSSQYIALFEPCYESATPEMKAHMDKHNYARGIHTCCEQNGLKLITRDDDLPCIEPTLNKTTFMMFEKADSSSEFFPSHRYVTPDDHRFNLDEIESSTLFCRETEVMYPSLHGIRLISPKNAVHIPAAAKLI